MGLVQFLAALTLLGAPGGAGAAQPVAAAKSATPSDARWLVDWGQNQCSLVREAAGAPAAGIALQLVPGTESLDIVVVDESWSGFPVKSGEDVTVRLDVGEPVSAKARRLRSKERVAIVLPNLDRGLIDLYAKASSITIEARNKKIAHMSLPAAAKAVQALQTCERDILKEWKVDTAALATLRQRAKGKKSLAAYVSDNDYPPDALQNDEEGTSVVRLTIEPDGKASACGIVSSSGSRALDLYTCAIFVRRAEYHPALDAAGRPVRSVLFTRLTWRIAAG
jgi:TonB family protein